MGHDRKTDRDFTTATGSGALLSRRAMIKAGGALALSSSLPLLQARSALAQATPTGEPVTITTNGLPPENQPDALKVYNAMVKRFEDAHPNITVKSTANAWDPQTFPARLAAGTLEDAYQIPYTEPQGIIARGQAADITADIKRWDHFDSFNPGVLKIVQDANGNIYGVPVFGYALGLIYNRTFFQDAGLDPDAPPATWDDLRDAAKKATTGDHAGYAETSKDNQGGWHFTAWMYSAGGELEQQSGDKWQAVFNNDTGIEVLKFLQQMRFTDKSMTERQLLSQDDTRQMLATGQIAMSVQAPDTFGWLKDRFPDANMEDFGMGVLPQNGGNATLAGGSVWMFNPKSSPAVLQAAVEWILYSTFDLDNLDARLAADAARGALVGAPEQPLFTGEFQQQRQAVIAKHANAPIENYKPFVDGSANLALKPEPPIETQQMYAAIDPVVQAILTDDGADPKKLLDDAAQQFQTQVLDKAG